jgi:hypothetical protein
MEDLVAFGKELLLVPIWALIQAPALRLAVKLNKASSISLKAAFMLGLIISAASLVIFLVIYPLNGLGIINDPVADGLSLSATIGATVWLYGYFLRSEMGDSIGALRGLIVFALQILLFLGVIVAAGVLIVIVNSVLK